MGSSSSDSENYENDRVPKNDFKYYDGVSSLPACWTICRNLPKCKLKDLHVFKKPLLG